MSVGSAERQNNEMTMRGQTVSPKTLLDNLKSFTKEHIWRKQGLKQFA